MSNWLLALIGAILVAAILHWYPEHKACVAKGGALTRYGVCVQIMK